MRSVLELKMCGFYEIACTTPDASICTYMMRIINKLWKMCMCVCVTVCVTVRYHHTYKLATPHKHQGRLCCLCNKTSMEKNHQLLSLNTPQTIFHASHIVASCFM